MKEHTLPTLRFFLQCIVPICTVATASAAEITIDNSFVEYEVKGNGPQVVLFEAGAPSGMLDWDSIWYNLPDDITAIRYSRRGEGGSGACTGQMSAADYADDAAELLAKLEISSPIIYVAHSYGGDIARDFASRNPDAVRSMLLVDPSTDRDVEIITTLDPVNGPGEIEAIKANDFAVGEGNWCFLHDSWLKDGDLGFAEIGDIPITVISGVRRVEEPSMVFETDAARALWGQFHTEWVSEFPRGRAVVTEGSGHMVHLDEPDLVLEELSALLELPHD